MIYPMLDVVLQNLFRLGLCNIEKWEPVFKGLRSCPQEGGILVLRDHPDSLIMLHHIVWAFLETQSHKAEWAFCLKMPVVWQEALIQFLKEQQISCVFSQRSSQELILSKSDQFASLNVWTLLSPDTASEPFYPYTQQVLVYDPYMMDSFYPNLRYYAVADDVKWMHMQNWLLYQKARRKKWVRLSAPRPILMIVDDPDHPVAFELAGLLENVYVYDWDKITRSLISSIFFEKLWVMDATVKPSALFRSCLLWDRPQNIHVVVSESSEGFVSGLNLPALPDVRYTFGQYHSVHSLSIWLQGFDYIQHLLGVKHV